MKPRFFAALLVAVVVRCYGQGYYPLEIGNRWDYGYLDFTPGQPNHFVYTCTVTVLADTIMGNGLKYSALSDGSFLRQEGTRVFSYSASAGEHTLYDFALQGGDTMYSYYSFDTLITTVYSDLGTLFGRQRRDWMFYTRSLHTSFYSYRAVADSFGYHYGQWEPGANEYCLGAFINGVTYGTLTATPQPDDLTPNSFSLAQNYPNPFNPTTHLRYVIGVAGGQQPAPRSSAGSVVSEVRLAVYDLLGREVAVLVHESRAPGIYEAKWDAARLPSGVYICRMTAGGFAASIRMVLMK